MKILAGREQFLHERASAIAERIQADLITDIEEVAGEDRYLRVLPEEEKGAYGPARPV